MSYNLCITLVLLSMEVIEGNYIFSTYILSTIINLSSILPRLGELSQDTQL